ncbi:alpha/beta family hydrolase [Piscinibacter sp. HJYY11]|uniref:alpha/beta hydrolase family protein n=1 Tax=Piscinibacter sp. HJYY11 TaxID=2801333 RepID=UPI00191E7133|nr:alpha/beta family hydrolase [Piscinibacter sp. HJYY11]MBL0730061.1 alpha/beta hydrolase [Piscinibacter sp. HJYY11]
MTSPQPLSFDVPGSGAVAALSMTPADPIAGYVFAHGAGAGMDHAFMSLLSDELAQRRVASFRFQFPFMQQGSRRPDTPAVAQAAVRAAVAEARRQWPALPLFAGGKSFGGRMSSQAQAASPLAEVRGLVFVGFPLHLAGKPSVTRAAHLAQVRVPMLFLQGTRDALADLTLLREVLAPLGPRATLAVEDDADHAFHVRVRSGRTDPQVLASLADTMAAWCATHR